MKRTLTIIAAAALSLCTVAQTPSDLRFNEICVERDTAGNVENVWVEIFNPTYSSIDMSGLYITDDPTDMRKCPFLSGSTATQFLPRGFVIVDGDGDRASGALHTNFKVSEAQRLYLIEANGYTVIDSVDVPAAGITARTTDGKGAWQAKAESSRGFANVVVDQTSTSERFRKVDPYGGGLAIISMSVVFAVLVMLAVVFTIVGRIFKRIAARRNEAAKRERVTVVDAKAAAAEDFNMAAVAAVVAMYVRDKQGGEPAKLTINRQQNRHWRNTLLNGKK